MSGENTDVETSELFPCGQCECTGEWGHCQCAAHAGPAAFSVVRNGRTIRVCTRCDLPTDSERRLLVSGADPSDPFFHYDILGFMCIGAELAKADKGSAKEEEPQC